MITNAGLQEVESSNAWIVWVSVRSPDHGHVRLEAMLGVWGAKDTYGMIERIPCTKEDVMESLLTSGPKGGCGKYVENAVRGFAEDLMAVFGEFGTFLPPNVLPSKEGKLDAFMKRLSERAFRDCLAEHRVADRLSYEQALSVIQEVYVVDPIMSS